MAAHTAEPSPVSRRLGVAALATFAILLVGLPLVQLAVPSLALARFDTFFRVGALVFGGGHVVLPLLHGAVVDPGWVNNDRFLAGYGAAQAVPGPLFTFAAYLGAVAAGSPNGWMGAIIALLGIFLPSFLLTFGTLPFWDVLRRSVGVRRRWRAPTEPWWASCSPRSTPRSGRAPSGPRPISHWPWRLSGSSCGARLRPS